MSEDMSDKVSRPKEKVRKLKFGDRIKLLAWMRKNDEELASKAVSQRIAAQMAGVDLGLELSTANIMGIIKFAQQSGEPLRYVGRYTNNASGDLVGSSDISRQKLWNKYESLDKRVKQLEEYMDKLKGLL